MIAYMGAAARSPLGSERMTSAITGIATAVHRVPLRRPFRYSKGQLNELDHVTVEVRAASGETGRGEVTVLPALMGETAEGITAAVARFSNALVGLPSSDIRTAHAIMDALVDRSTSAKAAVDFAMYDLTGKELAVPVATLLGGMRRTSFETVWVAGVEDTETTVNGLLRLHTQGYRHFKLKIGLDDAGDVERVEAVRAALPSDARIRLDGNQAYTAGRAIRVLRRLSGLDIDLVEQPCHRDDVQGMAEVRGKVELPLMADESVASPSDALRVVGERAADVLYIKPARVGGIFRALEILAIAQAARVEVAVGGNLELLAGSLANLHFAAAAPIHMATDGCMGLELHEVQAVGDGLHHQPGTATLADNIIGLGTKVGDLTPEVDLQEQSAPS